MTRALNWKHTMLYISARAELVHITLETPAAVFFYFLYLYRYVVLVVFLALHIISLKEYCHIRMSSG